MLDFLFPRICTGCGAKGAYLCRDCKKKLVPHPECCPLCHARSSGGVVCRDCSGSSKFPLRGVVIGFSYDRLLKPLLLGLKYRHSTDVLSTLVGRLVFLVQAHPVLSARLASGDLVFSWVPSHWTKRWFVKGYNQSELLAKHLANALTMPCIALTNKKKRTVSQTRLGRAKRFSHLQDVFVALPSVHSLQKNATIVLVDDLLTTGATLGAVAQAIHTSRDDLEVWGVVMARKMG